MKGAVRGAAVVLLMVVGACAPRQQQAPVRQPAAGESMGAARGDPRDARDEAPAPVETSSARNAERIDAPVAGPVVSESGGGGAATAERIELTRAPAAVGSGGGVDPVAAPMMRVEPPGGNQSGLEVRWWLASDGAGRVGRVLALHGREALEGAKGRRWDVNGLRMVKVRVSDLALVEEALPPIGARNIVWVGWATKWTEVMRGRSVWPARAVLVDGEPRALAEGTLRFIARSWGSVGAAGPELNVELAVQLHEASKVIAQSDPFEMPTMHPEEQQGEVFRGLTVGRVMEEGWALVIAGEKPGVEWSSERAEAEMEVAPPPAFGPPMVATPTIGEAMLGAEAFETGGTPAKAVVVLVPRMSGRKMP